MDEIEEAAVERADREKREREQLAAERAKLDAAQLMRLDYYADQLRESDSYAVKHELALAHIIRTETPHQQRPAIATVLRRAESEADAQREKDQATAEQRTEYFAKTDARRAELARDAEAQHRPDPEKEALEKNARAAVLAGASPQVIQGAQLLADAVPKLETAMLRQTGNWLSANERPRANLKGKPTWGLHTAPLNRLLRRSQTNAPNVPPISNSHRVCSSTRPNMPKRKQPVRLTPFRSNRMQQLGIRVGPLDHMKIM